MTIGVHEIAVILAFVIMAVPYLAIGITMAIRKIKRHRQQPKQLKFVCLQVPFLMIGWLPLSCLRWLLCTYGGCSDTFELD